MSRNALVLFSGGQDSTTCLADALSRYSHVETLGFDYGQRHRIEIEVRRTVLARLRESFPQWAARLGDDHLLDARVLGQVGTSALTQDVAFAMQADGLPNTFVPGRNLLFLTLAGALAYRRGLDVLVIGVCETDYSGYPDCRDNTIKAMQLALSLGLERPLAIETPLMWIDKAQTWALAHRLGGDALVRLIVQETHTCYEGNHTLRHPWGYGCGTCAACQLRARGWEGYKRDSPNPRSQESPAP
ncbi:MAG: 7-cyano-7-deazaguanine synthase QueC [Burkholderiaceae bacterium]|jgi:7-cyano-7-deazaguanine synthase|nr:7-cyano-7-deazaguanine synthase QueC [Burkholderiaceae bacterium]